MSFSAATDGTLFGFVISASDPVAAVVVAVSDAAAVGPGGRFESSPPPQAAVVARTPAITMPLANLRMFTEVVLTLSVS